MCSSDVASSSPCFIPWASPVGSDRTNGFRGWRPPGACPPRARVANEGQGNEHELGPHGIPFIALVCHGERCRIDDAKSLGADLCADNRLSCDPNGPGIQFVYTAQELSTRMTT